MGGLFLYGPPASGKTTLGRLLSERLGAPFRDLDDEIVRSAGRSVPEIFSAEGEAAFRRREREALAALPDGGVVALGGGSLLDDSSRALALSRATVVVLDVLDDEIRRRVSAQAGTRPLGATVLEARRAHYASFPAHLAAHFPIDSGDAPSDVFVGRGLLPAAGALSALASVGGKCVVVADSNTARPHGEHAAAAFAAAGIPAVLHVVEAGEENKNIAAVSCIWRAFLAAGLGRRDFAVAVGGGVVGDMTGFAAATWMRGIPWVNIPTSLLSMVDASTGGKTGCDLPEGKNLVGAFHSPRLVVIDEDVLSTLPERELRSGKAEWIKHDIISGRRAASVAETLAVKVGVVREDPLEKGVRAKLNAGHTVGHALEIATGFALSHGEAVAIGTVEEARLAVRLGLAAPEWPDEAAAMFSSAGLPTALPAGVTFDSLRDQMARDKKQTTSRRIRFALPCGMGDVRLVPVEV
jgi:3-dehydroquinate synthetase